ncbi:hypothetical protein BDW72DRAFT_166976 [Aspergillus terricola var. indicus]
MTPLMKGKLSIRSSRIANPGSESEPRQLRQRTNRAKSQPKTHSSAEYRGRRKSEGFGLLISVVTEKKCRLMMT